MAIAIFLPNWIGDVVMATPAFRALRDTFPDQPVYAVCRPYVAGVVEGSPWFDGVIPLNPKGGWSESIAGAAWNLRRVGAKRAVLFPNSIRSALVARLGGCRERLGFLRMGRAWLLTDALRSLTDDEGRFRPSPIIDDYNRLAMLAGTSWPGHRMELFTTEADERAAHHVWDRFHLGHGRQVICLNPGAAFGAAKFWPSEYFSELARDLFDQRDADVLILCGPSERNIAREIAAKARRPRVVSLDDNPLSLGLTKALVRRADLLVTTDSGPRHFAAAFNRPVVTLFGPTHIAWTETYFHKAIHLQKKVACGPCQQRVCPLDHRCMTQLMPAEVYRAVEQLLDPVLPMPVHERKVS